MGRRYTGTSGKVDDCQVGVFAAYATEHGRAQVDGEFYLPKSWTGEGERCRAAKIPEGWEFAAEGDLAKAVIARE
ncbi:transposase [Streptomyces sp. NPDC057908]|uniref:transposase n=1 Tax=Streptomyces sp. NPDC057908 TaxID=3346276 RepID=UPI0036EE3F71